MKMTLADLLANFQPVQGRVQVTVQGRLPISRQKESFPALAANFSPTMGGAPTAYPGIGVPNPSPSPPSYRTAGAEYMAAAYPPQYPQPPAGHKAPTWGAEPMYANPYDAPRCAGDLCL